MTADELAEWVTAELSNSTREGERGDMDSVAGAVYGFDSEVFVETVESLEEVTDFDDDDERTVFAFLLFELGYAWSEKRAEEARELQASLGL